MVVGVGGLPEGILGCSVGFQGLVVLPLDLPGGTDLAMQAGQLQAKIERGEREGALECLLRFLMVAQDVVDVAEAFKEANPDFTYTIKGPGTGDGFKVFCKGETDISDASRKIKDEEAAVCKDAGIEYIELAVAFDGMTVMTNPENSSVTCLSFADLYALIGPESQGFTKWSDAQALAKELGSNTTFPAGDLTVTGPHRTFARQSPVG